MYRVFVLVKLIMLRVVLLYYLNVSISANKEFITIIIVIIIISSSIDAESYLTDSEWCGSKLDPLELSWRDNNNNNNNNIFCLNTSI